MKTIKIISALIACTLLAGTVPYNSIYTAKPSFTASASYTDYLTYTKYSDHIEITDCDESATEIEIPSEIDGLPVTIIGDYAFSHCCLESIAIPEGVISIGSWTFIHCEKLTSVIIPDSVISIGYSAFGWCESLTSIIIPDSVTHIGYAFSDCSSLISITIENPYCEIFDHSSTISNGEDNNGNAYFTGTIYGYENSTAQAYAEKCRYTFAIIDNQNLVYGDANCDGDVDMGDAVAILKYCADPVGCALTEQGKLNADIEQTGNNIDASDALAIQKLRAMQISSLPESYLNQI